MTNQKIVIELSGETTKPAVFMHEVIQAIVGAYVNYCYKNSKGRISVSYKPAEGIEWQDNWEFSNDNN